MSLTQQILDNQGKILEKIGKLEGILVGSNGDGHEGRIKTLERNQGKYITFRAVMLVISMWTVGLGGLTLFAKLAGLW